MRKYLGIGVRYGSRTRVSEVKREAIHRNSMELSGMDSTLPHLKDSRERLWTFYGRAFLCLWLFFGCELCLWMVMNRQLIMSILIADNCLLDNQMENIPLGYCLGREVLAQQKSG